MACFELDKLVTLPHSFLHQFPQGVEVVEITPESLSRPYVRLGRMFDYIVGFASPVLLQGLAMRGITSKIGFTRIVVSRVHGTEFACVNMHLNDENENTHFAWFYPKIEDVELKTGRGYGAGVLKICDEWGG